MKQSPIVLLCAAFAACLVACAQSPRPVSPGAFPAAGIPGGETAEAENRDGSALPQESGNLPGNFPPGLVFLPSPLGEIKVPAEAGAFSPGERPRDEALARSLAGLFYSAYVEAVFMDTLIAGVLGGDWVHRWPSGEPVSWVQNWRSFSERANSWALPSLILAVKSVDRGRVFPLEGAALDYYGRSAGVNRANGAAGYGAPLTAGFARDGRFAMRFDLGLMAEDESGKIVFYPETPPSRGVEVPEAVGSGDGLPAELARAFIDAWKTALDQGFELEAAGPVRHYGLAASPWPVSETGLEVRDIYIQTFNESAALLVLPVISGLFPLPRLVTGPFLAALVSGGEEGGNAFEDRGVFEDSVMEGLARFGVPLTDRFFREGKERQRFSAGWLEYEAGL